MKIVLAGALGGIAMSIWTSITYMAAVQGKRHGWRAGGFRYSLGGEPWILMGERSGSQPCIAAMESGSLCAPMKKLTAFVELESAMRACRELS